MRAMASPMVISPQEDAFRVPEDVLPFCCIRNDFGDCSMHYSAHRAGDGSVVDTWMCYICGAEATRSVLPPSQSAFWCIFHERVRTVLYEKIAAGGYRVVGTACVTQEGTTLAVTPCPHGTTTETIQVDDSQSVSRLPSFADVPAGQEDVVEVIEADVVQPSAEDIASFVAEIDMGYDEDVAMLQSIVAGTYDELDDGDDDIRVLGDIVKSWH